MTSKFIFKALILNLIFFNEEYERTKSNNPCSPTNIEAV